MNTTPHAGRHILGNFLNGVAETRTVVKMSVLTLAIYLPLALAWAWGPYGLLVAYILANAASTVYGIRQTSMKYDARPDLNASARILLAALVAAVPTIALIQLDRLGVIKDAMGLGSATVSMTAKPGERAWPGNVRTMQLDISKIKRIGWKPIRDSDEAIRIAVDELFRELAGGRMAQTSLDDKQESTRRME